MAKKAESPKVIKEEAPKKSSEITVTMLTINNSDIPEFNRMLELAKSGVPSSGMRSLVDKLSKQV